MSSGLVFGSRSPTSSPGVRFSKVPKCFRAWKVEAKSQTLRLQIRAALFIHLSVCGYRLTKNGFAGPKSFRERNRPLVAGHCVVLLGKTGV